MCGRPLKKWNNYELKIIIIIILSASLMQLFSLVHFEPKIGWESRFSGFLDEQIMLVC